MASNKNRTIFQSAMHMLLSDPLFSYDPMAYELLSVQINHQIKKSTRSYQRKAHFRHSCRDNSKSRKWAHMLRYTYDHLEREEARQKDMRREERFLMDEFFCHEWGKVPYDFDGDVTKYDQFWPHDWDGAVKEEDRFLAYIERRFQEELELDRVNKAWDPFHYIESSLDFKGSWLEWLDRPENQSTCERLSNFDFTPMEGTDEKASYKAANRYEQLRQLRRMAG